MNITAWEAHVLIKACEALTTIESHGAFTQEEIDFAPSLITRLTPIAGDVTTEPANRFATDERTLDDEQLAALVAQVKMEIIDDIGVARSNSGELMPLTVGIVEYAKERGHVLEGYDHLTGGYSELHDYVDANCYGGACEDDSPLTVGDLNAMQDAVNEWLVAGGARVEVIARSLWNDIRDVEVPWAELDDEDSDDGSGRDFYREAARGVLAWMQRS